MPGYQPILMASWTLCTGCWVPVRAQDQARHDAAVHAPAESAPPVLQEVS